MSEDRDMFEEELGSQLRELSKSGSQGPSSHQVIHRLHRRRWRRRMVGGGTLSVFICGVVLSMHYQQDIAGIFNKPTHFDGEIFETNALHHGATPTRPIPMSVPHQPIKAKATFVNWNENAGRSTSNRIHSGDVSRAHWTHAGNKSTDVKLPRPVRTQY